MTLRTTLKSLGWLAGLAASLLAPSLAQAKVNGITGPNFNLVARPGFISATDGISIYNWGYGDASSPNMQYPGPTLIVTQGQTVTVALTNNLPTRTSIVFPGQSGVTCLPLAQCIVTSSARLTAEVDPGATVTYSFVASNPGTYTYHSGTQMDVQVEMGLMGALVVRPSGFPSRAYGTADTAFTPDREYLLMLSELDAVRHQKVYDQVVAAGASPPATWRVNTSSFGAYAPRYWFINGRNSPDTLGNAFAPELPNQPYNALVQMHPGNDVLLRVVNMGRDLHPFHHHGNNTWTVARDGRPLKQPATTASADLAQSDFTLRMVPGQTVDAIWRWTGAGLNWDIFGATCNTGQAVSATNCMYSAPVNAPTTQLASDQYKPLPVALPSELNLTYGEMFSGNPFLGKPGTKPVGAGLANTSNGFFHMMHSHNERELVNDGVFPGGMMTMVLIQPPGTPITE